MTDKIPDETMREAQKIAGTVLRNLPEDYGDVTYEINVIARALMARDQRAAEIATEYRHSPALIPGVILSYDEAQP